jgi:hypothetical protein
VPRPPPPFFLEDKKLFARSLFFLERESKKIPDDFFWWWWWSLLYRLYRPPLSFSILRKTFLLKLSIYKKSKISFFFYINIKEI